MTATITSGPAPLGVVFDATATTSVNSSDPFRQIVYDFDFGDPGSGNFAYGHGGTTTDPSGSSTRSSRNRQVGGPIAAHVFSTPGTYTVTCSMTDQLGGTGSVQVTITVADPDVFFSAAQGRNTVYVSSDAAETWVGVPAAGGGITRTITNSVITPSANTRYLYKRGQTFSGTWRPTRSSSSTNIYVGAWGSGARPIFTGQFQPNDNLSTPSAGATFANKIALYDLQVNGGILNYASGSNILFHNCVAGFNGNLHAISLAEGTDFWASSMTTADFASGIIASECSVTGSVSLSETYCYWSEGADRSAIIGCFGSTQDQHNFRGHMSRSIIAHNEMRGISQGQKHSIKLHGHGGQTKALPGPVSSSTAARTSKCVIADNFTSNASDNNNWPIAVCPQNSGSGEGQDDIMIENNKCYPGPNVSIDVAYAGRRITTINNVKSTGGAATVQIAPGREAGLPAGDSPSYFANRL